MQHLIEVLKGRKLTVAVAEGDTGGLLLAQLTALPGSSAVLLGGVVAYADDLKRTLLQVNDELLREHGAVSAQVALAMARGVRSLTRADVGVATTGIAGPGGATATKPVGLAYIAVTRGDSSVVRQHRWSGDRQSNRQSSVDAALALLDEILQKSVTT